MTVPRLLPGIRPPVQAPLQRNTRVDVTVSDRGVRASPVLPAQEQEQITSDPALQEVLSPEEIQALQEQFASWAAPAGRSEGRYDRGGLTVGRPSAGVQGRLIDLTG